jgi:hypothetical protein
MKLRRVIGEWQGREWLALYPDGAVKPFEHAQELASALQREDRRAAAKGPTVATVIEWRNVPADFKEPDLQS